MSDPFIGQLALFSFNYAPKGWAICQGQSLPIAQNQALFSLLGTSFGGNGQTTFALPNLQGACLVGVGPGYKLGQTAGEANHTLQIAEIPSHQHALNADPTNIPSGNVTTPIGNGLGVAQITPAGSSQAGVFNVYSQTGVTSGTALDTSAIGMTGGQAHNNMMPTQVLSYCIALTGVYPTRS